MATKKTITYLLGDAAEPFIKGPVMIAHIVNDQGAWGAGFTKSIDNRSLRPGMDYRKWARYPLNERMYHDSMFALGNIRNTPLKAGQKLLDPPVWVCHMVAQQGLPGKGNPRPVRYDALGHCLWKVAENAKTAGASVHMPRIGCGLGGGDWAVVEQLVSDAFCREGIPIYVYDPEE